MFKYTCPSCGLTYYTKEKVEDAFCVSIKCGDISTIVPIELPVSEFENLAMDYSSELSKKYEESL